MYNLFKQFTIRYHMLIHVLLGVIIAGVVFIFFKNEPLYILVILGILGSILPDIEHFVFFYSYGKHTKYATTVVNLLKKRDFKSAINFCALKHKDLHCLYFHNGITPILFILSGVVLLFYSQITLSVMCFSASFHYLYDIFEDLYLNNKINPNWFMHFDNLDSV